MSELPDEMTTVGERMLPTIDYCTIQGGEAIILLASCTVNRTKVWLCVSLGLLVILGCCDFSGSISGGHECAFDSAYEDEVTGPHSGTEGCDEGQEPDIDEEKEHV